MTRTALITLALITLALPGHASVFDIYGFNPRGRAMGNAHAAVADDYTATFYNPAGLARRKRVTVGAGLIITSPGLTVDRQYQADHQQRIQAVLPEGFTGLNLGAVFPLGALVDNRVALGFAAYLPMLTLLQADAVDAQVPQFYRYETLPNKFVILSSLAVELTPWLSIGGGVQVLAGLDGAVDIDIELANERVNRRTVSVEFGPTASPTAGLLLTPIPKLTIGVGYRASLQLDYSLPSRLRIDELITLDIDIRGTVLYTPAYYNVGVAYDWTALHTLLSGELTWARWSKAPNPSPVFILDIQGELAEELGLGERFDVGNGAEVDLAFRDVPVLRFGVEHQPHEQIKVRAGYTWRPTPAPLPTETFNYIDNDAHIIALGAGYTFADPLEIRRNPMTVDVVYQATLMAQEGVSKRSGADDPVGNYSAGGVVHSVGISVRHDL